MENEDFIAVGDGVNDYPMFDFAGLSIGINLKDTSKATINFDHINKALKYLLTL
ncbi:MAG: HAD hydrolase family protein [Clostridia bacterium]|nr:HAD hydrolase family protein [Clostridia bacterium]